MVERPDIATIRAAADRIAGHVRATPLLGAAPLRARFGGAERLLLKLENLQATGSFKARGAMNVARSLDPAAVARGLITASGGNHGLGVAYAAASAGTPARIYLPTSTPEAKAAKLRDWGADVVVEGAVWDEANEAALAEAERSGMTYVHPFADPAVIAGQGTVALEALTARPDIDVLLVAVGGGGLISGSALAAKALKPGIRVIGIEAEGAPTLHASRAAGELVTLAEINTAAGTLAPRRSEPLNFGIVEDLVDDIVLVGDEEMRAAARLLWFELGIAVELSAAAPIAALMTGRVPLAAGEVPCAIVCGAGTDGIG
ncbi:threonine ammonia-lyase [Oceanibacterium hippocampi]|uniref:Phenylserine dehydratase n=1 Tax=Oceanibacterium hippocampi TaxID=745714 RepID=A0A1Y5S3X2_9PROT|nr:threonine/serine dehydratase [Oceanibacterium hippocampi]SLN29484.1 Phenylserine dehydratase [Oceanibacterium hippocampi]